MTSASDAELLEAYVATTWRVAVPPGAARVRVDVAAPQPLRSCGVVTAYNPLSVPRPRPENQRADERLRRELTELGAALLRSEAEPDGADADRWREPGYVALGIGRDALLEVARRFEQNALVWIDADGRVSLLVVRDDFCGQPCGSVLALPR